MSVTALQLFTKARALIDEYTEDGVVILDSEIADIKARSLLFMDMAQKQLYGLGNNFKNYVISNSPAPNLLGHMTNFEIVEYIGTVQYYPDELGISGATAYYIEVQGHGTVEIQDKQAGAWTTLTTLSPDTTTFTAYSGLIDSSNEVRIKISGDYHYRHRNRCLYSYPFESDKIPVYKEYYPVEMPSDFKAVEEIIREDVAVPYQKRAAFKWQGKNKLMVYYGYEGTLTIVYRPIPATIDAWDDVLEIDEITAECIPYFVAELIALHEQVALVEEFQRKYALLKYELSMPAPAAEEDIIDEYGLL